MNNKRCFAIDFDDWSSLARQDPEGFEARRRALLEAFIKAQPIERRHRLYCVQWRIDRIRERSGTPMLACQKLSELMWDAFAGPTGLKRALADPSLYAQDVRHRPQRSAKILPFRRPAG